jgi:threonine dehydrogenase-like Zn-dependent dehydrogenase
MPVTLGHEFSATVAEVGTEVRDIQPGDKVAVFPLLADFSCGSCLRGRPNCCANAGSIGFSGNCRFPTNLGRGRFLTRDLLRSWGLVAVHCYLS